MANVFAITTVTDKLDAETGSTTTVFTATNKTPRPLRGVAKAKPLGNTKTEWIRIEGETERDFPPGGTHQFTVSFTKPQPPPTEERPAESFQFRLDLISSANPDEDFTEGQVVTVNIPEGKVPEPKPFPWWIPAVAGLVLLIAVVVVVLVVIMNGDVEAPKQVQVPDLKGKTITEAAERLDQINKENGTNLTITKVDDVAPNNEIGKIFRQNPDGGEVGADTAIEVTIPAVTAVPRVIGLTYSNAKAQVEAHGLTISGHIRTSDAPTNQPDRELISFQSPLSGTVRKGSEVQVFSPCKTTPCLRILQIEGIRLNRDIIRELQNANNR